MTIKVKGINTGSIKSNERFALMAFKIRDIDNVEHTFFFQLNQLIDLLLILRFRIAKVSQRLAERGESYKEKLIDERDSLMANVPNIDVMEVNNPDISKVIMSMAPKQKDEKFELVAMLQNEQIECIEIDDTQIEFIVFAIQQSLNTTNDKQTIQLVTSLLDFVMLYFVDLSDMTNLNFRKVEHEKWKLDLFTHYIAVLFCFEHEEGKKILAGTILKTEAEPNTEQLQSILHRVAVMSPGVKALQDQHPICQTFAKIIPSQPNQLLTMEECMQPLHDFCVEVKAAMLNA